MVYTMYDAYSAWCIKFLRHKMHDAYNLFVRHAMHDADNTWSTMHTMQYAYNMHMMHYTYKTIYIQSDLKVNINKLIKKCI